MKLPVIDGREAIPVRLIPFITYWPELSADVLAELFAGWSERTWELTSFTVDADGDFGTFWPANWCRVSLDLDERAATLKAHGAEHVQWRKESLELLPADCFVWRDEFEAAYQRAYGRTRYAEPPYSAKDARRRSQMTEEEDDADLVALIAADGDESECPWGTRAEPADGGLNYSPSLSSGEREIAFEGFDSLGPDSALSASSQPGPEAVAPAPAGTGAALPNWSLKNPARFQGYRYPLFMLLKRAYDEGRHSPPNAQDVLEAWRAVRPPEIVRVLSGGFDYLDGNGVEKSATLDALRRSIGGLVVKQGQLTTN